MGCCRLLDPKETTSLVSTSGGVPSWAGHREYHHHISKILPPSPQILCRVCLAANSDPPRTAQDFVTVVTIMSRQAQPSESKNQLFNCTPWYLWFHMNSATFKVWPRPMISQQKQMARIPGQQPVINNTRLKTFLYPTHKEDKIPSTQIARESRKKAFKRPTHRTRCLILFWMRYGCLHVWVLAADLDPHITILHRFSATWRPLMRSRR